MERKGLIGSYTNEVPSILKLGVYHKDDEMVEEEE